MFTFTTQLIFTTDSNSKQNLFQPWNLIAEHPEEARSLKWKYAGLGNGFYNVIVTQIDSVVLDLAMNLYKIRRFWDKGLLKLAPRVHSPGYSGADHLPLESHQLSMPCPPYLGSWSHMHFMEGKTIVQVWSLELSMEDPYQTILVAFCKELQVLISVSMSP